MAIKKRLLAGAIALATMSSVANAESPYSNMYVFGDSLSDTGAFGGKATNRVDDYQTGPFAKIAVELFANAVGVDEPATVLMGGTNYAVGGFRSDEILASVISMTGQTHGVLGQLPSLVTDTGGMIDQDAVYYVFGGGNDFLQQYDHDGDGSFGAGDIGIAAGNVFGAAYALGEMGANYIVVPNLVALEYAPAIQLQQFVLPADQFAALEAGISQGVQGFNMALELMVSGSEHNIIMQDTYTGMMELLEDPFSFGLGYDTDMASLLCFDVSQSCQPITGLENLDAMGGVNPAADADFFLFNDPVHPTGMGHAVIAFGLESIFTAPDTYGAMPLLGLADMKAQSDSLSTQLNSLRYTTSGSSVILSVTNDASDFQADFLMDAERKSNQFQIGYQAPIDEDLRVAVVATINRSKVTAGASMGSNVYTGVDSSTVDSDGIGLAMAASYKMGGLYVDVMPEFMAGQMSTRRELRILAKDRVQTGDTNFVGAGIRLGAGFNLLGDSAFKLGPFADVSYRAMRIDGLREDQYNANAMFVGNQRWNEENVGLGIFAGYSSDGLHLDARYKAYSMGDVERNQVNMGLQTISGNTFWLPGPMTGGDGAEIELSAGVDIGDIHLSASYRMVDSDELEVIETANLTARFQF